MKSFLKFHLLIIFIIILSPIGCATMVRGTNQSLSITSEPQGAIAKLSTGESCITPCKLKLKRNRGIVITYEKEGCESTYLIVSPQLSTGASLMAGGIDTMTGTLYDLEPNPAHVVLDCANNEDKKK